MPYHIAVNINKFILLKPLKTFSFSLWCHLPSFKWLQTWTSVMLTSLCRFKLNLLNLLYNLKFDTMKRSELQNIKVVIRQTAAKNGEEQTLTAEQFVSYVLQN